MRGWMPCIISIISRVSAGVSLMLSPRRIECIFLMVCMALPFSSCQKQILEDEEDGRETPAHVLPRGTGEGTFEYPFTVRDVQEGNVSKIGRAHV